MVGTVRSDEAQVEYQQDIARSNPFSQVKYLASLVRKGKIWRLVAGL
jgi:hypothetical protein